MKRPLLLTTLIVISVSLFGTPVKEKEIVLKTKEHKIYGTLKIPETKEKIPIVLLIAGSGPTDRDCNSPGQGLKCNAYKMLTDSLNNYGIATLSYDKRGIGKSVMKQKEEELCFNDFVEDAKSWIELISKNKQFSEIIVVGHSEGSLIGMIAAQNNPKVSKYVSLAGIGLPADEILKEQLTEALKGQPENLKDQAFSYIDELKKGKLIEEKISAIWNSLFRPSVQPYLISWFKYNPQEEIKKLEIPVLILQGNFDIQVSENDAELLYLANPSAKKVIIKNMNHVLKNSQSTDLAEQTKDSYNNPASPINRELVAQIVGFVKVQEMTEKEIQSYAVGVILGEKIQEKIAESRIDLSIFNSLKETIKEKIDFQSLKNGLQDIMKGECKISKEEIKSVLEEILKKVGEIEKLINQKKEAEKNEETASDSQSPINYQLTISRYHAGLSYYYLFTKEYAQSEQSARKALELDGTYLLPKTNLAHALLFLNRFSEAEAIYKELSQTIYQDNETYTQALLNDFAELEKAGVIPENSKNDVEKIKQMLQQ